MDTRSEAPRTEARNHLVQASGIRGTPLPRKIQARRCFHCELTKASFGDPLRWMRTKDSRDILLDEKHREGHRGGLRHALDAFDAHAQALLSKILQSSIIFSEAG
jgi:hypothetical protein